jgi:hypothetical protein
MKREPGMAYDTKVLNKIFAVISVIFLLVVIWMVFDDFIRPWKAVQIKAMDIEKQKIQERIKEIDGSIDGEQLKEVKAKITAAEKELKAKEDQSMNMRLWKIILSKQKNLKLSLKISRSKKSLVKII